MRKDSKIYVAGHKGLVGSAIWKNLRAKGYTNLIGKTSKELDLLDPIATAIFFEEEKPEYVFLAAAYVGGIMANNIYRADFIYKNLQIQQNVIYNAYKNNVTKLLFLGSTCIYPKNAHQPINENELLTDTLEYTNEPYAIAKIAGIKMCESFNLQYGTNFISVMPTNLYGPNDNFDLEKSHVLPAMIRKIYLANALKNHEWKIIENDLLKRPVEGISGEHTREEIEAVLNKYGIYKDRLELWGTGKPMREFLWSEEMGDACVFIMENVDFKNVTPEGKEIRNTHINIGTGSDICIKDLSILIASTIGYNGNIFFDDTKPDGTMRKLVDASKINQLGWKHSIDIEKGVELMFKWYLNN
ncbi:GDP-L-fucose synthase [Elizabethkingia anophelis]|uniref:GDP-L-fucose synthase family protein n=1 Tax=Elizabethkingia anophelis TaxID=1117645 RepID=UPI001365B821|nr:GDP-L-fucose synthase [Elizabethkingia anophelis]MCT3982036.1 GDP-L-fucose synthase [Elizabethkingia anophelis]MDV4014607.1 GDP-fucose synthetase [Elizabethkingia anophelis]MVW83306.1 GDP-L-fucose synthase [Elizabethkingia anophelis]